MFRRAIDAVMARKRSLSQGEDETESSKRRRSSRAGDAATLVQSVVPDVPASKDDEHSPTESDRTVKTAPQKQSDDKHRIPSAHVEHSEYLAGEEELNQYKCV